MEHFGEVLEAAFVAGCFDQGGLVGVAGLHQGGASKTKHRGVVWGMFVEPQARGRGVGGLLLSAVIAEARLVVEDLTLAVARHNEPAVRLYRRQGFADYGLDVRALKLKDTYVDELLMRLALD